MKVALIGDVHANLPALEKVLADAQRQKVEAIWNIGDFVGYNAFPDEVMRKLRKAKAVSVVGNYDLKVLDAYEKGPTLSRNPEKRYAFQWAYDHLGKSSRRYLAKLPREVRLEVGHWRILLTHGSPESIDEHLTPQTPQQRLEQLAAAAGADVVIVGHSHIPMVRKAGGVWFINTGSVGRPDDGNPRAGYAIMNITARKIEVRHFRLAYDVKRAAAAIRDAGMPEDFAQMILRGVGLNKVKELRDLAAARAEGEAVRKPKAAPLRAALQLARKCHYEQRHTHHVTDLALKVFDLLGDVHHFGMQERNYLQYAGLLHDIGWVDGRKNHHKRALQIILQAKELPLDHRERLIVGSIARYHRKVLPSRSHDHFAALEKRDRDAVCLLAGILRVADGLDVTHQGLVKDIHCEIAPGLLTLHCKVAGPADLEEKQALEKGRLLAQTLNRNLIIRCHKT